MPPNWIRFLPKTTTLPHHSKSSFYISLSEAASLKLSKLRNPLRVRVDSGGCSGFQYRFLQAPSIDPSSDIVFQPEEEQQASIQKDKNLKVVIDDISIEYLNGAQIDYTQQLIGESFQIFSNPNASSSCGCKISFDVKS